MSVEPFSARLQRAWRSSPAPSLALDHGRALALRTACCGAVLAALLLLLWLTLPGLQRLPHTDLYPGYVAARLANEGRWEHIYHPTIWLDGGVDPEWDRRALELTGRPLRATSFVYHPWYLCLLRPIVGLLGYRAFQAASLLVNELCVVFVGLGLALLLRWRSFGGQLFLTLLVAFASTTISGILLGQNVLLALTFALAASIAWQSAAPLWLGGLCAALAWTAKPWCALLLVPCFVLRGPRAGVHTAAAVCALMLVLPELLLPRALMRDYHALNLALSSASVWAENNLSVLASFDRAGYPDWGQHLRDWVPHQPAPALRLAAAAVAGLLLAALALVWRRRAPGAEWASAAWLTFMLFPLGICWDHYFVFAFPLACLASLAAQTPIGLRVAGSCALALLVLLRPLSRLSGWSPWPYAAAAEPALWHRALPLLLLAGLALATLRWAGTPTGRCTRL